MKTCRRVTIPEHLPEKEEAHIQSLLTSVEAAINKEMLVTKICELKPPPSPNLKHLG